MILFMIFLPVGSIPFEMFALSCQPWDVPSEPWAVSLHQISADPLEHGSLQPDIVDHEYRPADPCVCYLLVLYRWGLFLFLFKTPLTKGVYRLIDRMST